jgi:hypothetical protein
MRFAPKAGRRAPGTPAGPGPLHPGDAALGRSKGNGNRSLANALQALSTAPGPAAAASPAAAAVRVSQPGDREEVQADRMAQAALAGTARPHAVPGAPSGPVPAPGAPSGRAPVPAAVLPAGPGEPLPAPLRADF